MHFDAPRLARRQDDGDRITHIYPTRCIKTDGDKQLAPGPANLGKRSGSEPLAKHVMHTTSVVMEQRVLETAMLKACSII